MATKTIKFCDVCHREMTQESVIKADLSVAIVPDQENVRMLYLRTPKKLTVLVPDICSEDCLLKLLNEAKQVRLRSKD